MITKAPAEREQILAFMSDRKYRPMTAEELRTALGVPAQERARFEDLLRRLMLEGAVVQVKHGRFGLPGTVNLLVGRLRCNPRGFGFLVPLEEGAFDDLYVSAEDMGEAFHDDVVSARRVKRHGRYVAEVVSVVRHRKGTFVGTYEERERLGYVAPDLPNYFKDITVAREDRGGAQPGDKVAVRVTEWPTRHLPPQGIVVEVLGRKGEPGVDTRSIIVEYGLPDRFPDEVKEELKTIPSRVSPVDVRRRLDLREETIFTVDPEEAKDFDDAVSVARLSNGNWRLGVHIADVSHYVRQGSAVSEAALERGTSVYLPGHVIPMLPEKLSNGICSLVEGRARLTKSVFITFDPEGRMKRHDIRRSVIRSAKRFTYEQLLGILEGRKPPEGTPQKVVSAARLMGELAQRLRERRMERGYLDIDLPEARLVLDENERLLEVKIEHSDPSHGLIEEFMLAANEAVADHLHRRKLPAVARAHDPPDLAKLDTFARMMRSLGFPLRDNPGRKDLQRLLAVLSGRPGGSALRMLLLRSMKQADYRAEWAEHYALAAMRYTHFTSPIRRLPDLIVHQLLDIDLDREQRPRWARELPQWMEHASMTERRAADAERELSKIKVLEHLAGRRGEIMDGTITGIQEYGIWIELSDYLMDGLVRLSSLTDDFYTLDSSGVHLRSRHGRHYFIGQKVKVQIAAIDELKRQLDLVIVVRRER
jgi:ribonuclease R